ncbi:hypothetical protein EWH99_10545 [Sporolactobacillus sp. THM7-7]|nr:hypothetical protein EWH99_10545 [Sporolactobacillus sp. THM7-7]
MNTLIYEFNPDGSKRPVWLLVDFDRGLINDQHTTLYVDTSTFGKGFVGDLDDDMNRCTVELGDLVSGEAESQFGINLLTVKGRVAGSYDYIDQFVVQVADIVQVMVFNKRLFE